MIEDDKLSKIMPGFYSLIEIIQNSKNDKSLLEFAKVSLKNNLRSLEFLVKPNVSVEADSLGKQRGLKDLVEYSWKDQPSKMKDKGRTLFHWEHVLPVSVIYNTMVNEYPNKENILKCMKNYSICWITKEEDQKLTSNGFRHDRNYEDPWSAYREVGIQILK